MKAQRNGIPMIISSGYVCQVDKERCVGCGACVEKCQFGALALQDGHVVVDVAACMGCGVCVNTCPQSALVVGACPGERPAPLEIHALMAQAITVLDVTKLFSKFVGCGGIQKSPVACARRLSCLAVVWQ